MGSSLAAWQQMRVARLASEAKTLAETALLMPRKRQPQ
jgi:hypothetical protein